MLFGFSQASAADVPQPGATTAELSGPYEDRRQAEVTFGQRSYYLAPWRAYMDTWPAQRYLDCLGVSFNANPQQEDALAQVLAEAGFHQVRVEWGWGKVAWDGKHMKDAAGLVTQMQTLRRHGLRPLILLNGHHGGPCPTRDIAAVLKADAKQGDREIILADTTQVRPGYCGFSSLTDYKAGYPLIDHVDAASGRCVLSAPLPKDLKAGAITLIELRYRPFSGSTFKDGQVNPACAETLQGWMDYVAAVTSTAKAGLGTEKATDAGFDLEVWNEYTFGSDFLNIANYCNPQPEFATPISYRQHGREAKGVESILPMTIDWVADPANRCPRVKVISGFANQRPWDSGSEMWPGQAGFSRHYYTGLRPLRLDPKQVDRPDSGPLNALGLADGKPDGKEWHGAVPGSFFVPVHSVAMPEWWFYGYKTEFITRDIQPFPSTAGGPVSFANHHRYSHPGTGRTAEVWQTETNLDRSDFADVLMKAAKCAKEDPRLATILHAIGARGLLRQTLFSAHKGIATMTVFSTNGGDTYLGVLPDAFFTLLTADGGKLTDRVRAAAGPQLAVIGRVAKRLSAGEPIDVARKLELTRLVEHDPRLVWKGDGTPGNPDRFQRDDFACLPFQLSARRFAVGYYVVTQDMTVVRDATRDVLDIARYAMKPQTYDLTLSNLAGKGATVTAWDPITEKVLPVQVLEASASSITVRVVAADYPCFLDITEASPGPLLAGVRVEQLKDRAEVVFTGNAAGTATIEWGPYPQRRPAGLTGAWKPGFVLGEYFSGTDLKNLRSRRMDAKLELDWKGPGFEDWPCVDVSVRWSGRIRVPTTGTYTFTSASDDGQRLWVAGRQLVDDWNGHGVQDKSDSIDLEAGKMVDLRWEYFQGAGGAEAKLTWTPPGGQRQAIPAAVILPPADLNPFDRSKPLEVAVVAGKETRVPLPGASAVDGVQISFAAAGLACRWPQWTYDVRGVLSFSAPVTADVAARGQLPALPEGAKAVAYTAGKGWAGNAPRQTAVLPGGGEVVLEWVAGDPWSALPVASTVDRRDSQVEVWNGMHSWTIDDRLEAVAHPGEKLLARRIRCVPVRDGVLLFTVRCADAAALQKAGAEIAALASTVAFTR